MRRVRADTVLWGWVATNQPPRAAIETVLSNKVQWRCRARIPYTIFRPARSRRALRPAPRVVGPREKNGKRTSDISASGASRVSRRPRGRGPALLSPLLTRAQVQVGFAGSGCLTAPTRADSASARLAARCVSEGGGFLVTGRYMRAPKKWKSTISLSSSAMSAPSALITTDMSLMSSTVGRPRTCSVSATSASSSASILRTRQRSPALARRTSRKPARPATKPTDAALPGPCGTTHRNARQPCPSPAPSAGTGRTTPQTRPAGWASRSPAAPPQTPRSSPGGLLPSIEPASDCWAAGRAAGRRPPSARARAAA